MLYDPRALYKEHLDGHLDGQWISGISFLYIYIITQSGRIYYGIGLRFTYNPIFPWISFTVPWVGRYLLHFDPFTQGVVVGAFVHPSHNAIKPPFSFLLYFGLKCLFTVLLGGVGGDEVHQRRRQAVVGLEADAVQLGPDLADLGRVEALLDTGFQSQHIISNNSNNANVEK